MNILLSRQGKVSRTEGKDLNDGVRFPMKKFPDSEEKEHFYLHPGGLTQQGHLRGILTGDL